MESALIHTPVQSRSLSELELNDFREELELFQDRTAGEMQDRERYPESQAQIDEFIDATMADRKIMPYKLQSDRIREILQGTTLEEAVERFNVLSVFKARRSGCNETPLVTVNSIANDQMAVEMKRERLGLNASVVWRDWDSLLREPDGIEIVLIGSGGGFRKGEWSEMVGVVKCCFTDLHPNEYYSLDVRATKTDM